VPKANLNTSGLVDSNGSRLFKKKDFLGVRNNTDENSSFDKDDEQTNGYVNTNRANGLDSHHF